MAAAITTNDIRLVFKQAKTQALTYDDLKERLNAREKDEIAAISRYLFAAYARAELVREMEDGKFQYLLNPHYAPVRKNAKATVLVKPEATSNWAAKPKNTEPVNSILKGHAERQERDITDAGVNSDGSICFVAKLGNSMPMKGSMQILENGSIASHLREAYSRSDEAVKNFLANVPDQQVLHLLMHARDEALYAMNSYEVIKHTREVIARELGGAS